MEFVRSLKGYDHLWAVRFPEKETDELTLLFRRWGDINYLLDFFGDNLENDGIDKGKSAQLEQRKACQLVESICHPIGEERIRHYRRRHQTDADHAGKAPYAGRSEENGSMPGVLEDKRHF